MVEDDELDKFIEGELKKDITQEDSIDPNVEQNIGEMGFLWNRVHEKFKEDNICFKCKNKIKSKKEKKKEKRVHVIEAKNVDKGVIAFVCLCSNCYKVMNEETNKIKKGEKNEKVINK